jgi:hypothetical protein
MIAIKDGNKRDKEDAIAVTLLLCSLLKQKTAEGKSSQIKLKHFNSDAARAY